ncbi:hypothetical protein Francci3_2306 [Frankia casuarinae]|uniref:Uncharacterized protein n=1 Tax=Frankia casuarinae (strain DSM 45818 / CECT 9043 / HFP020203 / CcI3) TaxID=106370 RepID=Q2JAL8_FRACC|nr:hypothetical protein Francci3_2306 [Frankia casuarinae]
MLRPAAAPFAAPSGDRATAGPMMRWRPARSGRALDGHLDSHLDGQAVRSTGRLSAGRRFGCCWMLFDEPGRSGIRRTSYSSIIGRP